MGRYFDKYKGKAKCNRCKGRFSMWRKDYYEVKDPIGFPMLVCAKCYDKENRTRGRFFR